MRIKTIYKESEDRIYKYPVASSIVSISVCGRELLETEYIVNFEENTVCIIEGIIGEVAIEFNNNKEKIIGFTDKHIFNYCDNDPILENNKRYRLEIDILNKEYVEDFETKLSPMHCKPKDIKRLLGSILEQIGDIDLEYYIFETSREMSDLFEDQEKDEAFFKKLVSHKVSLDIIYQYYYTLVDEIGTDEDSVGTLKFKRQRLSVKLDDLIHRFEKIVDSLIKGSGGKLGTGFTKASSATTPLGERTW